MKIIIAKHSGFCEGVHRAYRIATASVKSTGPIFILGDLVHNKDVVEEFKRQGIKKVKALKGLPRRATLIITAHGTTPKIVESAKERGLKIVDTTCPWVKKAQAVAKELSDSGRQVVIVGDKGHPEVKGLFAWAGKGAVIVEKYSDLKNLKLAEKVGIIAQTTQSEENFRNVVSQIRRTVPDVSVHNTICGATARRQCSAKDLAEEVDIMLVVGDLKSANTKRLAELCRQAGVATHHIQNAGELKPSWLKGKGKVGITGGASTPERVIKEVVGKIKEHAKAL
jgi:small subunit ribosomal protein S1